MRTQEYAEYAAQQHIVKLVATELSAAETADESKRTPVVEPMPSQPELVAGRKGEKSVE